jgi:hypothetical protein
MTVVHHQSAAGREERDSATPDRREILDTVGLYSGGFNAHDADMFRRAFHPSAWIFFTWPDGHLYENLIADEVDGWSRWDVSVSGRVLDAVQAGDVATVLLAFDQSDGNNWVDFHSLLRVDGTWKIMNKTATHASRAAWAGEPGERSGAHSSSSPRSAPDRDVIIRTVHLYTDGMGAHDLTVFQEAFHPDARISYSNAEGEFHEGPMTEGYEPWADWPTRVTGRIVSLIQAGDVAVVVLGFDADTGVAESWLDIHSLLRIDGGWKIMNKTATHASRADWAGRRLAVR